MLINLRNALMAGKRFPYDAEVEYLFADGGVGAYINSGILWKSSLRVKCTLARYQGTSYPLQSFFGARDVSAANAGYTLGFNTNIKFVSDNSGTRLTSSINCEYYGIYTIDKKPNEVTIFGNGQTETLTGGPSQAQQGTYPLYIFGLNNVGTAATTGMCLYSLQIWDNGDLVRDYIPVRKGTVGYLYDRVSGKLFGNAGTGDFVLGQDVVLVEYIESHGTEYIDTGITPSATTECNIDLMFTGTVTQQFGTGRSSSEWAVLLGYYQNKIAFWAGVNQATRFSTHTVNERVTCGFSIPDGTYWLGGNPTEDANLTVPTTSRQTFALLARKNATNRFSGFCTMRVYSADINGVEGARKMLPVRVGTEGAMMDVLTRRIYRNQGTGAFAYGNDLKYPIPAS